jgi:hypothetical protein
LPDRVRAHADGCGQDSHFLFHVDHDGLDILDRSDLNSSDRVDYGHHSALTYPGRHGADQQ